MTRHQSIVLAQSAPMASDPLRRMGLVGRLVSSNRYVLGLGLILAVALPDLLRLSLAQDGKSLVDVSRSIAIEPGHLLSAAAITAAHLSLRRMGMLPLVTARSLILPTLLVAFGCAMLAAAVLELVYSAFHIWTSFTISFVWYLAIVVLRGRYLRPVVGMIGVPPGLLASLPSTILWQRIDKPKLDKPIAAAVVDPHGEIDLTWSKFIANLVLGGVPVYHLSQFEETLTGKVYFTHHADNNFGALLPSLLYLRFKRGLDLLGCIIALPFAIGILAAAALAIRLDSPGPVLFKQPRTGFRGKTFLCYKLRTMTHGHAGPAFTKEEDPRITRVGAVLRRLRIDELPQLFNIIRGEMSWIGPRPEAVSLAEEYSAHVPFYDYRHAVRPGISGWAAVHQGNVANVDAAKEKLAYDFFYIKYFSVWLDLLIVIKTARTVLTGFGAR